MSENEAIEFLKGKYPSWGCDEDEYGNAQVAIQALEEIQQYRAIGTIEQLETLQEDYWKLNEMCKEYSAIGTIEECRTAVERMKPRKAIVSRKHHEAYCPNCNYVMSDDEFYLLDDYIHYCEDCGQAVKGTDWSE